MAQTTRTDLKQEWLKLAPAWIKEAREGRNPTRNGLLDKPMLEACGDVRGLRVLDSGCGEGCFCRILLERGAEYVLGLDICEPMIHAARERDNGKGVYRIGYWLRNRGDRAVPHRQCAPDALLGRFMAQNRRQLETASDPGSLLRRGRAPLDDEGCGVHELPSHSVCLCFAYSQAGLTIGQIVEPTVDEETRKLYPELEDEVRVPNFILFVLKEPPRSLHP